MGKIQESPLLVYILYPQNEAKKMEADNLGLETPKYCFAVGRDPL